MKVKACFLCKQYTPIHPDNPLSCEFVKEFEGCHHKHPTQIVNREEVPDDYICITPKNREKAYAHLGKEYEEPKYFRAKWI